jgi:hypothetical protein
MAFGGSSALMAPRVDRTIGSRTSARWGAPSGLRIARTIDREPGENTESVHTPEP